MSKTSVDLNTLSRVVFLVLLAFLVLGGFGVYILLFFAPLAGWFLWRDHDRIIKLEKKLAALEKPSAPNLAKPSEQDSDRH